MARWKELPGNLDHRERQLIIQLRRLKDRSGLTLAALEAKTTYSSSSWERYLNGKKPVPRGAVEELTRVCGAEPTRLLVLSELAGAGRSDVSDASVPTDASAAVAADDGAEPGDAPGRAPRLPRRFLVAVGVGLVLAFGAGLFTGQAWHRGGSVRHEQTVLTGGDYRRGQAYACHVRPEDGALHAGYSLSRDVLLDTNSTGWDVVEAQCLLRQHGYDVGRADGLYGDRTKSAARAFQKARGIAVDGIIGPDTWRELRK